MRRLRGQRAGFVGLCICAQQTQKTVETCQDDHIRERDLLREGLLSPEAVESAKLC